jgi:predicted Fe-Mo cluster-binding NifX family protein
MKIAVTSTLPNLDACVGTDLNYCKCLLIVDLDTMEFETIDNPVTSLGDLNEGERILEKLLHENITIILANNYDANILRFLGMVGIQIIDNISGSVHHAVKQFKEMCMADTVIMSVEALKN